MVFQALYQVSRISPFQMDQQMGKVVVQEKIFPSKLLQMPTLIKCINIYFNFVYVHMKYITINVLTYVYM